MATDALATRSARASLTSSILQLYLLKLVRQIPLPVTTTLRGELIALTPTFTFDFFLCRQTLEPRKTHDQQRSSQVESKKHTKCIENRHKLKQI